jgi:23S rRNA (uracil1939-C5)-methyltransferase
MHSEKITIEKIVNGGFGLGHLPSNMVVLVQFGLPGETVIVTTQESKKNYLFGKVHQIEQYHPARIAPPCQYYTICGGCNLQHCNYETQLILKRDILLDLLLRQNIINENAIDDIVAPVLPAPSPFHYRQRIRLQVKNGKTLGFNRFRSNEIIEIQQCLLAKASINRVLLAINTSNTHRLLELSTELELLQDPSTDMISCIFRFKRKPRPADVKAAEDLCLEINDIDRIFFTGDTFSIVGPISANKDAASKLLSVHYPELQGVRGPVELNWEAGGFCQVNLDQNKKMIETVIDLCGPKPSDSILDLYCGMGNFALPIATVAGSVYAIEGQGSSIRCATLNASRTTLSNTTFKKQPVHKGCLQLIEDNQSFDCILIDPPRGGAPELSSQLGKLCKSRLVYISCDPATLCRDLADLQKEGFSIQKIQPVDMFPQTHHIETVVLLEK